MQYILPSTMMIGVSHMSTKPENSGLKLYTNGGKEFYIRKFNMLKVAKEHNSLKAYFDFIKAETHELERILSDFINDEDMAKEYKMDDRDEEGWAIYHELLDSHTVCQYLTKTVRPKLLKG